LESDGTVKNSDDTPLDSTSGRSFEERLATLRSVGECANQYELGPLLKKKAAPVCYVWCDVSPWMHITQGILMALNVNKMIKAGCKVKILMADWFAWLDWKIGHIVQGCKPPAATQVECGPLASTMPRRGERPAWISMG
jgi:tyrosyl-tRNA synthetase